MGDIETEGTEGFCGGLRELKGNFGIEATEGELKGTVGLFGG